MYIVLCNVQLVNKILELIMKEYLKPTYFINSDSEIVIEFAKKSIKNEVSDINKGINLFYSVRDGIRYNPYTLTFKREQYTADYLIEKGNGYCIQKAILYAAAARAVNIPSRLRFVNVRNHLATENLIKLMKTDIFVFHGCTELYLENKWVKATPTFNLSLCEKFGVHPLEFNGKDDALFHPFDRDGRKHMEYVHDYGPFADFPMEMMISEMKKYYPHLKDGEFSGTADFEEEAAKENIAINE